MATQIQSYLLAMKESIYKDTLKSYQGVYYLHPPGSDDPDDILVFMGSGPHPQAKSEGVTVEAPSLKYPAKGNETLSEEVKQQILKQDLPVSEWDPYYPLLWCFFNETPLMKDSPRPRNTIMESMYVTPDGPDRSYRCRTYNCDGVVVVVVDVKMPSISDEFIPVKMSEYVETAGWISHIYWILQEPSN